MRAGVVSVTALSLAVTSVAFAAGIAAAAPTSIPLSVQISTDPLLNVGAQHQSEVEPVTAAWGSTIVSTFQVGRFATQGSGAAATGWATSTNGGASWTHGLLTGINTATASPGNYPRSVNETVAYDAAHGKWLIVTLGMALVSPSRYKEVEMFVSDSADGLTWSAPRSVVKTNGPDKSWIVCDNHSTSSHYGRCYVLYSASSLTNRLQSVYTNDGSMNWSTPVGTATNQNGYDVNPIVQPNGNLVVLATATNPFRITAFRSTNGGASFTDPVTVSVVQAHSVKSFLRQRDKPSAAVADDGTIYTAWHDCRFRSGCTSDDIVLSRSSDGGVWSAPTRVAVDPISSTIEHYVAGLGVQPATVGAAAHLDLVFMEMPNANCTSANCQIDIVTTSSADAGSVWSPVRVLTAAPQSVNWLPSSNFGAMIADYWTVAYVQTVPWVAIPIAQTPSPTATDFQQSMFAAPLRAANTVVPVTWSATEVARIAQLSSYLGVPPEAVQKTSVYIIAYLLSVASGPPTPVSPPAPGSSVTYTSVWDTGEIATLDAVQQRFVLNNIDATHVAVLLVSFLASLGGH